MPSPSLSIQEIPPEQMGCMLPLLQVLNPDLTEPAFQQLLQEMLPLGYRAIGAYEGPHMVGLSGFWIGTRFWCGRLLDIDNFVVHPDYRGLQVGEAMIAWLEALALREECALMVLDVFTDNYLAHRFYQRMDFSATGYHFTKLPGSRTPYQRKRHTQ